MSDLIRLSRAAHERALQQGGLCPHERGELNHLPMRWDGLIPVFDAARMTDEQIWETGEALRALVPDQGTKKGAVRDAVKDHMVAYGRFGLRVKDVCSAVGASKVIVLKYLRELEEAGEVRVSEEVTRGGAASKRKRYFLVDAKPAYGVELPYNDGGEGDDLRIKGDRGPLDRDAGSGICHHGTPVHALMCPHGCSSCQAALEEAFTAEAVSAARRAGGSGFAEGLELRTRRRLAAEAIWETAARKVGV